MPAVEDRPGLTLVKSASRDARVSCETLSQLESPHRLEDAGEEKWHSDDESDFGAPEIEQESENRAHEGSKVSRSSGHLFACFPPRTALHILPRPLMSPGRDGKRGGDFGGRSRAGVAYSGPMTHSGPMGSLPHSGPLKIGTGSMTGHSGMMKGVSRGHSGPFTMIPPDVVGKKKPPGYESDEPTSPEVTCIGRVRIKQKHWAKAIEEKGLKDRKKGKWFKKKQNGKETQQGESPGRQKRSIWQFMGRKEATNGSRNQEEVFDIDLRRFTSACEVSPMPEEDEVGEEGGSSYGKGLSLPLTDEDDRRDDEGMETPPPPPPNSLLLMKGGSRNWDRQNEQGVTPAEAVLLIRGSSLHRKDEDGGATAEKAPPNALVLMRGSSKSMERQNSLPESRAATAATCEGGSIWKRRSIAKPCTLDVKKDTKWEVKKQPMTR